MQKNLIHRDSDAFEEILYQIHYKNYEVLSKNEGFLVYRFESLVKNPENYLDHEKFFRLKQTGEKAIVDEDFDTLRKVLSGLSYLRAVSTDDDSLVNIFRM